MHRIFYAFLKLISLLPLKLLYAFSDFIYLLIYYLVGYRKKVVYENIKKSFPEKSEVERKKIIKNFYRHFSDRLVEILKLISISEDEIKKRMIYINGETFLQEYEKNKSAMIMTSHFGNWEWTSSFSLFLPNEKPVYQVYRRLKNESSDYIANRMRKRFGAVNVEKDELLRKMVMLRKERKLGVFGMISDQSPAYSSMHYFTAFLHQRTPMITGTESIARKFDYPVYYARIRKIKRGYYSCEFQLITEHPADTAEFEITEKYARLLEKDIIETPELWLWTHKRWKYSHVIKK